MAEKPPTPRRPYRRYHRGRPGLELTPCEQLQEPAAESTSNKNLESKLGQQKASELRRNRRQGLHAKQESAAESTRSTKQGQQQDSDLRHSRRPPLAGIS